jgi:hypothetical protein
VDSAGNLYIADFGNGLVRKVSAATGLITTVAGYYSTVATFYNGDNIPATTAGLYFPDGLAMDSAGNLYIADSGNYRVRKVSAATGIITTVAGDGEFGYDGISDNIPATTALVSPFGLALDIAGNLYSASPNSPFTDDPHAYSIRKVSALTGLITTVAGTGIAGYNGDNIPATSAHLNFPSALAIDSSGKVYITDTYNSRVRVLVPPGCIASLSGGGGAFAASGGTVTINVTAPAGCAWNVSGAPGWVTFTGATSGTGNGTVTFQVSSNAGATLSGSFTIGGLTFAVTQASAASAAFSFVGSMAQLASGGGWETTLNLVDTGASPGEALINLWGDPSGSLTLPFTFPQSAAAPSPLLGSTLDETIARMPF